MTTTWCVPVVGESRAPDLAEVRRALELLCDPRNGAELFSLFPARHQSFRGDDLDGLTADVRQHLGSLGNYVSVNPVAPGFRNAPGVGARVSDFIKRRYLVLDIDPVRPSKDRNASEEEHAAARGVCAAATRFLAGKGWPDPLLIDSGGGWLALYRVDLPNDLITRALVKRVLVALAGAFDMPGATIDLGAAKVTFHARLPGTWNQKGPHEAGRPQRMARLARVPAAPGLVTLEQLRELAGPDPESARPKKRLRVRVSSGRQQARAAAYARQAVKDECARVASAAVGQRNETLNRAAFALGQLIGGGVLTRGEAEGALAEAADRAGLEGREALGTIKSGLDAGEKQPRGLPDEAPAPVPEKKPEPGDPAPERIIYRASEVTPREVVWLWPGRIPCGKLTTFAGLGGLGKTFVLCDIAARVTRGADWSDAPGEGCAAGLVLFISGEDDPDDTLVPRLIELGADLSRVIFLKTEVQDQFTLADLDTLDTALRQAGGEVRFVAIDPPTAYLGGVDDHKNAELRALLSPLRSWAARWGVAVVFNTHLNKQSAKAEALMRVTGSVAWVNAVRAAHLFTRDPEDNTRRLFVPMKSNLGSERKGLAYRIVETERLARVEWLGEVRTTADQAVTAGPERQRRDAVATEWLVERFRERREWSSEDLFETGRRDGVHRDAIFAAKRQLELPRARRSVSEDGSVGYFWWVPADWPLLSQSHSTEKNCDDCDDSSEEVI